MTHHSFGYFDYVIGQCMENDISRICVDKPTKELLIESIRDCIEDKDQITDHSYIWYLKDELESRSNKYLDNDTRFLLEKCLSAIQKYEEGFIKGKPADYENWFDTSIDACWLLVSLSCTPDANGQISLVRKPILIPVRMNRELHCLYEDASMKKYQIDCIEDALKSKKLFRKYEFIDNNAKAFAKWPTIELKKAWSDYTYQYSRDMTLFYAFTATCMLAYEIGRERL